MAPGGKVAHPLVWFKFLQAGEGCFSLILSIWPSTLPAERLGPYVLPGHRKAPFHHVPYT